MKNIFHGRTKANTPMPQEEAYKRIREYGYEPIDEYTNNRTRMNCYDKEGYIVRLSLDSLGRCNSYQRFSPTCNKENFIRNLNLWGEQNNFPSKVIGWEPSKTVKGHTDLFCECSCDAHNIFRVNFVTWHRGDKIRCNDCTAKISNIELAVKNFLDEKNVAYQHQYRFKNCRDKRPLPFDFYLPSYNTCIEVDGEQHFIMNSKYYKAKRTTFEDRKRKDLIKNKYCEENGIRLIRLKYDVVRNDKFKQILLEQLNLH